MKKIVFFILLVIAMIGLHAQDFKVVAKEMREALQKSSMHVVMDVRVFESAASSQPFYTQKGEVMRQGEKYYYNYEETELLINDQFLIMVNNTEKQILVGSKDAKQAEAYRGKFELYPMDSLWETLELPSFVSVSKGIEHYRLTTPESHDVTGLDMYIDKQNKRLEQLEYQYATGQRAIIRFEKFDHQTTLTDDFFETSRFFSEVKGKKTPSKPYSGYEIIEIEENKID